MRDTSSLPMHINALTEPCWQILSLFFFFLSEHFLSIHSLPVGGAILSDTGTGKTSRELSVTCLELMAKHGNGVLLSQQAV